MYIFTKNVLFYFAKYLGIFYICRFITKNSFKIICYHGISIKDEHRFRPGTFMHIDTFKQRLSFLRRNGFPVLGLEEALSRQDRAALPPYAIVITIDDGWHSTFREALPALKEHDFPATVYVTSYYATKGFPVLNLLIQYMLWLNPKDRVDLSELGVAEMSFLPLRNRSDQDIAFEKLNNILNAVRPIERRWAWCQKLASCLNVDLDQIDARRSFYLMTTEEIRASAEQGYDIQLHTHRHRLPIDDRRQAISEIIENRIALEPIVNKQLHHFCYPNGLWDQRQWPWLEEAGVRSATTCIPGFIYSTTPRLGLCRILDREDLPMIEFEAEICGFIEVIRFLRKWLHI